MRGIHGKDPGRSLGLQGLASRCRDWTVGHQQRHPLSACEKCRTSGPTPDILNGNLNFIKMSTHKASRISNTDNCDKNLTSEQECRHRECNSRNTLKITKVLFIFDINRKDGRRGRQGELVLPRQKRIRTSGLLSTSYPKVETINLAATG